MITNQVIQTSIDELKAISKVDLCVIDMDGLVAATTFENNMSTELIDNFIKSPADSQIVGGFHMMKILEDGELLYILIARGSGSDAYMIAKIAVSQIQNLVIAYKEHYDKNNFFQNLLLDNLLLVDIYNRAKKLHIEPEANRVVYLVEASNDKDNISMELLKNIFGDQQGCFLTAVEQKNIILVKEVENPFAYDEVERTAEIIIDMLNSEAMLSAKVAYGTIVSELKEVSKSYKEAKMALDVGKIFYSEKSVNAYNTLGIGRLIYQLPVNLCRIFMKEIFGDNIPDDLDDEILTTVQKFFDNNLNVSETSRQLFVHRNTLVYRIEKLHQSTGLDIRKFDDALTFKIALMVVNYMKYLDSINK
ncbi:MAG: helix-turn-helix domain-containing protein [Lachnospiraceae bacterium]|nr:helix-turn-helix domain-containing protein [Lachnospiraceae bacterium]MBQ2406167.1 helix-turn-helix domain-containing protein [Lachnospiraceae bacterium]MEE0919597.1 helix-turn-helix domain-containing protein [Lachnospiraceae bacterium]